MLQLETIRDTTTSIHGAGNLDHGSLTSSISSMSARPESSGCSAQAYWVVLQRVIAPAAVRERLGVTQTAQDFKDAVELRLAEAPDDWRVNATNYISKTVDVDIILQGVF
jgi:hypothetical protein